MPCFTERKLELFRENVKDRFRLNAPLMTPEQAFDAFEKAYKQQLDPSYPAPVGEPLSILDNKELDPRYVRKAQLVAERTYVGS